MRVLILALALAAAACVTEAPAPPSLALAPPAAGDLYSRVMLAPGVHMLTQGDVFHLQGRGNVEVIEQAHGVLLVDSGGSPAGADEVIAYVRSLTPKPVTAVVLTHWHGDHTLGVSQLLEVWPHARVISTVGTRDMLASAAADRYMPGDNAEANRAYNVNNAGSVAYLQQQGQNASAPDAIRAGFATAAQEYARFAHEMESAHRTVPTETFETRLDLPDPVAPAEVRFLGRANTAGDAIVWLPRQRVVITGDTVVKPIPYGFNSYPGEWISVLQQIRSLNAGVLAPGHGAPMRGAAYLDQLIEMLTSVRAQVAPLAADASITQENVGQHVDFTRFQTAFAGDDAWLRPWFNNYWKGPIAWSALREARNVPIVQGAD